MVLEGKDSSDYLVDSRMLLIQCDFIIFQVSHLYMMMQLHYCLYMISIVHSIIHE